MMTKHPNQNPLHATGWNRRAVIMAAGVTLASPPIIGHSADAGRGSQPESFDPKSVKAIVFDTVGTLVDAYGTISSKGSQITETRGIHVDWEQLYNEWNADWRRQLNDIISGVAPWRSSDVLFRDALDNVLRKYEWGSKLTDGDRDQLNGLWYELAPWGDTKPGLERLRNKYTLSTLSNNSMASLISFAKRDQLPFDCILTAELVQSGKPDPKVYALAARSLNLPPDQILMVAAHKYDLLAAHKFGFHVAYLPRPLENGPHGKIDTAPEEFYVMTKPSLIEIADALSA